MQDASPSSERHILVCHCGLVVGVGRSLRMSAALRIQKLGPVDTDEIPELLAACLFVVPGFGGFATFEVNGGAFVKVFAGDHCQATDGFDGEPFRVFLPSPPLSFYRSVVATENSAMAVPCWLYFTSIGSSQTPAFCRPYPLPPAIVSMLVLAEARTSTLGGPT